MSWWLVLIIIAGGLCLLYLLCALLIALYAIHPKLPTQEEMISSEMEGCGVTREIIDLPHEKLYMTNSAGQKLCAYVFTPARKSNRWVLVTHGYRYPNVAVFRYADICLRLGLNVIMPDHRYHGESEGAYITFGYYERHDCVQWVDLIKERFPQARFGVMGVSMGGAISILVAALDARMEFCIADCPYSSWAEELSYVGEHSFGKWTRVLLCAVHMWIRLLSGARVRDVDVRAAALSYKGPMLVIHGDADDFVPTSMAYDIKKARPATQLEIFPGAKHAMSYAVDRQRFFDVTEKFIRSVWKDI